MYQLAGEFFLCIASVASVLAHGGILDVCTEYSLDRLCVKSVLG